MFKVPLHTEKSNGGGGGQKKRKKYLHVAIGNKKPKENQKAYWVSK